MMPESFDVIVEQRDYKDPRTDGKVSTARLRWLISDQLTEVIKMKERCEAISLELKAIMQEIGEDW